MYLILSLGFIAFVFSLLLTPVIRDAFGRMGLFDQPDGIRKNHQRPTPRVGGIAILLSYIAAFGIVMFLPFNYRTAIVRLAPEVWAVLLAATVVFCTGLWDDLKGLKPWQKLSGELVAASIAYAAGVQIHLDSGNWLDPWLSIPLSIIWLIGCTNAFNLIDGMDGLATGVGLFATLTMLLAALTQSSLELALVTMPLVGCLLGFLRYNFNPASVFLGDCGSLFVGFLLGCFGVLWSQKSATLLGMTAPLMAMAIPLLDAVLSILRRFLRHQPIFSADRGHIHHRLLDRGLTPRRAALLLYGICGLAATFSLLQSTMINNYGGLVVVLFCVAVWIGIQNLGYVEFGMARQMLLKGTFRRMVDGQARLHQFEKDFQQAGTVEECWKVIHALSRNFGFQSVRMSIQGKLFEEVIQPVQGTVSIQLRIPLAGNQYVNFQRDMSAGDNIPILAQFAKTVELHLSARLRREADAKVLHQQSSVQTVAACGG